MQAIVSWERTHMPALRVIGKQGLGASSAATEFGANRGVPSRVSACVDYLGCLTVRR